MLVQDVGYVLRPDTATDARAGRKKNSRCISRLVPLDRDIIHIRSFYDSPDSRKYEVSAAGAAVIRARQVRAPFRVLTLRPKPTQPRPFNVGVTTGKGRRTLAPVYVWTLTPPIWTTSSRWMNAAPMLLVRALCNLLSVSARYYCCNIHTAVSTNLSLFADETVGRPVGSIYLFELANAYNTCRRFNRHILDLRKNNSP